MRKYLDNTTSCFDHGVDDPDDWGDAEEGQFLHNQHSTVHDHFA